MRHRTEITTSAMALQRLLHDLQFGTGVERNSIVTST